jgi:hypothetical protein
MKIAMYLITLEKGFQGSGCINGWHSRHDGKRSPVPVGARLAGREQRVLAFWDG